MSILQWFREHALSFVVAMILAALVAWGMAAWVLPTNCPPCPPCEQRSVTR